MIFKRRTVPDIARGAESPLLLNKVIQRIARECGMAVNFPEFANAVDPVHSISHATRLLELCNLYHRKVWLHSVM